MPVLVENQNPAAKSAGYWWLAALLLPVGALGLGVLLALNTPTNQNDWLGGGLLAVLLYTFACGCITACIASAISFWSKEEGAPLSLLSAVPCLLFLGWMTFAITGAKQDAKRQAISTAESYKKADEDHRQMGRWRDEFRSHPELITNDDFWQKQTDPARTAEWGLNWLLQDKTYAVTPEIKAYVIAHFPNTRMYVLSGGRSTHEELQAIVWNEKADYGLREEALDALLRDDSFVVSPECKVLVIEKFSRKLGLLFGGKKFTQTELEDLASNPKTPDWIKRAARENLKFHYSKP